MDHLTDIDHESSSSKVALVTSRRFGKPLGSPHFIKPTVLGLKFIKPTLYVLGTVGFMNFKHILQFTHISIRSHGSINGVQARVVKFLGSKSLTIPLASPKDEVDNFPPLNKITYLLIIWNL